MRRYGMLAATAVGALLIGATVADAAPRARSRAEATVTAVSVVPGAGRADVVLTFDGAMDVSTFTLDGPHRIVVDLQGATMRLREPRYDRVARAGIRNVRLGQFSPDVVRLVLDLDTPREYEVIRGEGEIRVSVRGSDDFAPWSTSAAAVRATPVVEAPPVEESVFMALPQQATQQRISVSFFKRDIHEVIATFADFSGRTFVTGTAVAGTVNADIVNQPWDVALSKILQQSGLQASEDSTGIITIDSYANLAKRVAAEPLVTQLVVVNYAKAAVLATTIRALIAACSSGSVGSESAVVDVAAAPVDGAAAPTAEAGAPPGTGRTCGRGIVTHEDRTNSLLITETVSRLPEIVSYIRDLDVRTPQVAIKAKIISVDRTATEEMGLSYEIGSTTNYFNSLIPRGTPGEYTIDLGGDAFMGVANANRQFRGTAALSLIYNTVIGGNNLSAFIRRRPLRPSCARR